jgi:hypothetical protein
MYIESFAAHAYANLSAAKRNETPELEKSTAAIIAQGY